jgi:hypothetical protein
MMVGMMLPAVVVSCAEAHQFMLFLQFERPLYATWVIYVK